MSRWEIVFAALCALIFAVSIAGLPIHANTRQLQGFYALFLIAFYLVVVSFANSECKPRMSMFVQTVLGGVLGIAIATIFQAPFDGYAAATGIGLVFGFFADMLVKWL